MAESSVQNQSQPRRGAGSNQGRKRPQGRGGKGGAKAKTAASTTTSSSAPNAPASSSPTPNDEEIDSSSKNTENPTDLQQPDDASQEQDLCWICAEPIKYYAVSECNHRTCHVCALRLRALYKKLDCTFCKVRVCVPPAAWTDLVT